MKKLVSVLLAVLLILGCFTACACSHEYNPKTGLCNKCGEACVHDFNEKGRCAICNGKCDHANHDKLTAICNDCGQQTDHEMKDFKCTECGRETPFYYENLPAKYTELTDKAGKVEAFYYDTYAYGIEEAAGLEKGTIAVEKKAHVYLPYGYDPDKQYNILYLMHGASEDENTWFGVGGIPNLNGNDYKAVDNVPMIDQVFALGEAEPFIIVTPTFYTYIPEDSEYASYSNVEGVNTTKNFASELMDIMTAVESTYKTYSNFDVSPENLAATREHRAYAGLSMGSMTSFSVIVPQCLQYFAYIGSFSGGGSADVIKKALTETYPDLDILYWYHGNGTDDFVLDDHKAAYQTLTKDLPDKLKEGENTEFVLKEGHTHAMDNWHIDLWNVMHVFFKK